MTIRPTNITAFFDLPPPLFPHLKNCHLSLGNLQNDISPHFLTLQTETLTFFLLSLNFITFRVL